MNTFRYSKGTRDEANPPTRDTSIDWHDADSVDLRQVVTRPVAHLAWTVGAVFLCLAVGCTVDEASDADDVSTTVGPADATRTDVEVGIDDCDQHGGSATSGDDAADDGDTADGSGGTLIDIEGIEVDRENTCISPNVTVLGRGPAEPGYYAPRCLRDLATGARYIARRGSAAIPDGFERCAIAPVVDWPICGQCECGGTTASTFDLAFACGADAGDQPLPSCGFAIVGLVETWDQCYYNTHTTAVASVYGVEYREPWVPCASDRAPTDWFSEASAAGCPEDQEAE